MRSLSIVVAAMLVMTSASNADDEILLDDSDVFEPETTDDDVGEDDDIAPGLTTIFSAQPALDYAVSSDEFASSLQLSKPTPPPSPPSPQPMTPPEFVPCDGIHLAPESVEISLKTSRPGDNYYAIRLKLWIRRWTPGVRFFLSWEAATPDLFKVEGARLIPRAEYSPAEVRQLTEHAVILELNNQAPTADCAWTDAQRSGGACVLIEGSVVASRKPTVSVRCVEGVTGAEGRDESLEKLLDFTGCALDEEPRDGYSLGAYDASRHSTEVRVLLRHWRPGAIVSLLWPGVATEVEIHHVDYNVAPTEVQAHAPSMPQACAFGL